MPERLPEHVVQPLLSRITNASLDEDYEHVAARRASSGDAPRTGGTHRMAAVVTALFGLLIVVAAVQTSREAATTEESRQALIRQIGTERERLAEKQEELADLSEEKTSLEGRLERQTRAEQSASRTLTDLAAYTGYLPVHGEGVRVRLDNSADGSGDGVVRDEDLATLVYGLWQAGAEAIAINGQRLTPLTGIRTVNQAIHVKTRPLRPPYVIEAIGDEDRLQAGFAESSAGSTFLGLRNQFGFELDIDNVSELDLPGRSQPYLREAVLRAQPPDSKGVTP